MKEGRKKKLLLAGGIGLGVLLIGAWLFMGIRQQLQINRLTKAVEKLTEVMSGDVETEGMVSGDNATVSGGKAGTDASTEDGSLTNNTEDGGDTSDETGTEPVAGGEGEAAGTDGTATSSAENTWDLEKVYTGGDEVVYNGKIYRARWWTQGEKPDSSGSWEDTLIAAGQTVMPSDNTDSTEPKPPRPEVAKVEDFKVVGYFPSWKENTDTIQYDVLTHINYAFAIPTSEGGLLPLENAQIAKKIIEAAHKQGVKVFIAVGGWSYHDTPLESTFVAATETEEKRAAFVDAIVNLCDDYGFDGVDMDWEHPRTDGNSGKQYEATMLALAEKLHAEGKQLSSAVLSGATADGLIYYDAAAHSDKVLAAVDWINVMAYDGGDGDRHSAYDFAVNCGTYWTGQRGLSADKVVLGVPFYARPSWAAYSDILAQVPDAWSKDHVDFNGMDAWYNGCATIEKKTNYALSYLGGIMIWEISQDAKGEHSLQTVIGQTVKQSKEAK